MAAATPATYAALLKELYPTRKIEVTGYRNRPFLSHMRKTTDFHGDEKIVPVIFEGHTGAAGTFSNAQTNSTGSSSASFKVTHQEMFALPKINARLMRMSMHNIGAIRRAIEVEFDSAFETNWNKLSTQAFRSGSGSIGQVGSTSSAVLTLKERMDMVHFKKGQTIDSDDVDGGGTVDGDPRVIGSIDRQAGTITLASGTWTSGGFYADDDFLFPDGDYDKAFVGQKGWNPDDAATSTSFFTIDRTDDQERLAGHRFTATAGSENIEKAIQNAAANAGVFGAELDSGYMNPLDFNQFAVELGSKVNYERRPAIDSKGKEVAKIGFSGIHIHTAAGEIDVFPDRSQRKGRLLLAKISDYELATSGPTVGFENEDGPDFLRVNNANEYEARIVAYGNFVLWNPVNSMNVDLSAIVDAS